MVVYGRDYIIMNRLNFVNSNRNDTSNETRWSLWLHINGSTIFNSVNFYTINMEIVNYE